MPISSFYGLQTSLRGLLAQQRALDTTGHNIANASTEGYSRQEAVMSASSALVIPSGAIQGGGGAQVGSGVEIQEFRRVRDQFLDLQYRSQNMRLGYESTRAEQLDRAEMTLSEPSDNGISKQLTGFYKAWSNAASNPTDSTAREVLVGQAKTLADAFSSVDAQLRVVGEQALAQYDAITGDGGEIEMIARDIANLNTSIKSYVSSGETPNDLLDARDQLLDRLSHFGQVSTITTDGAVTVSFGDAANPLVDGNDPYPDTAVDWPQDLSSPNGTLGALREIAMPGGKIDAYRKDLDTVAGQLADSVNQIYGAEFLSHPGDNGAMLGVAVAAADIKTSNGQANAIAALQDGLADRSYRSFVGRVGIDGREAQRMQANAEALTGAVGDRRQSVSGVALDEEMVNLVRFQRSYQASARAMSTMDEMLDVLINRTGRVGL